MRTPKKKAVSDTASATAKQRRGSAAHFASWDERELERGGSVAFSDHGSSESSPNTASNAQCREPTFLVPKTQACTKESRPVHVDEFQPFQILMARPLVELHAQLVDDAEVIGELTPGSVAVEVYRLVAARLLVALRLAVRDDAYVTTTQAAEVLGVARSTIVARIASKKLLACKKKDGTKWLIRRSALEDKS